MKSTSKRKKLILQLSDVCKRFGGVVAADQITLELYGGETFGLIGPNGAGKTTLLNLITGIYASSSGTITLNGKNITKLPTHKRARLGIARTFQHPRLLDGCDIRTNILMGVDLANKRKRKGEAEVRKEMEMLLERAGLQNVNLEDSIEKLSYGQQKMLEIVRALLSEPKVLLLDEPAAGLNEKEMEYIVRLIQVAVEKEIAVLLIEHAMDLVMGICDRLTVLNFGHQITTGTPEEVQANEEVIAAYLGGGSNA
ncbi:MAG: ABC transporter ATP-binding protein [Lachnospiraceae bacterium]|jgi:branched-chain amino acid transport system ATP-binding protein|nr:ABC transporter ATP-binding protein [Lachnospiraceae bacterium]